VKPAAEVGARQALVRVLQDADAGELAATYACGGHALLPITRRLLGWGPP
jgi:hypothetical protein